MMLPRVKRNKTTSFNCQNPNLRFLYEPANFKNASSRGQTDRKKVQLDWIRGHAGEIIAYRILKDFIPSLNYPSTKYGVNLHKPDLVGNAIKVQVKSLSVFWGESYVFQDSAIWNALYEYVESDLFAGVSVRYMGGGVFEGGLTHLMPARWPFEVHGRLKPLKLSYLDSKSALYVEDIPLSFQVGSYVGDDEGDIEEVLEMAPKKALDACL